MASIFPIRGISPRSGGERESGPADRIIKGTLKTCDSMPKSLTERVSLCSYSYTANQKTINAQDLFARLNFGYSGNLVADWG